MISRRSERAAVRKLSYCKDTPLRQKLPVRTAKTTQVITLFADIGANPAVPFRLPHPSVDRRNPGLTRQRQFPADKARTRQVTTLLPECRQLLGPSAPHLDTCSRHAKNPTTPGKLHTTERSDQIPAQPHRFDQHAHSVHPSDARSARHLKPHA